MFETQPARTTPRGSDANSGDVGRQSVQLKGELRATEGVAAQEERLRPPERETLLAGEQELYATPARIAESNAKLAAAGPRGSFIQLGAGAPATAAVGDKAGGKALQRVEPQWVAHEQTGEHASAQAANKPRGKDSEGKAGRTDRGMALATDCGQASAAIMGTGMFDKEAVYREQGQEQKLGAPTAGMMSRDVYLDLVPDLSPTRSTSVS